MEISSLGFLKIWKTHFVGVPWEWENHILRTCHSFIKHASESFVWAKHNGSKYKIQPLHSGRLRSSGGDRYANANGIYLYNNGSSPIEVVEGII